MNYIMKRRNVLDMALRKVILLNKVTGGAKLLKGTIVLNARHGCIMCIGAISHYRHWHVCIIWRREALAHVAKL